MHLPVSPTLFATTILASATIVSPIAHASFVLREDFENLTPGNVDLQHGWDARSGRIEVVSDPGDSSNQVLSVATDSSRLHRRLVIARDAVRMIFLRFRVSERQSFSFGLSPFSVPTQFDDFSPEIGMNNANYDLRCWNGGHQYEMLRALEPNTWYNLRVLVDANLDSYRIWLNSASQASADPATDRLQSSSGDTFLFRAATNTDLLNFFVRTGGGTSNVNSGPLYLDDIYVENRNTLNLTNPIEHPGPEVTDLGLDPETKVLTLTWRSSDQRSYRIAGSTTLKGEFSTVVQNEIAGTSASSETTASVTLAQGSPFFVRIEEE